MTQADSQTFRHVIGHFATGVTVVTTHKDGADFGATASAMSSLSLDPPMLLVCLNTRSITQEAIHATRRLGVNILGEDQGVVAERFASARGANKFAGMNIERGDGGVPLLADSLAFCECQIVEDVVAGTHRVFLANVTRAVAHDGTPLTYFRGKFGRFETQQGRVVYDELRSRILTRLISLEASLDIDVLAKDFDVLPATVYQAVAKLVADGLLGREPDRGYVVKPVTPESSDDAFDARAAMELGVAATTVGKVSKARVQAIHELMEEAESFVRDGRFLNVDAYTRHNEAFHNAIVDLADNPTLSDAYRQVGVAALMVSLLREGSEAGQEMLDDHRAIVNAYEKGDLAEAIRMIDRHNENAKRLKRRAIVAAGGKL